MWAWATVVLGSDHGWSSAAAVPKRHATRVRGVVVMTVGSALKAARITSSAGRCGRRLLRDRCDACLGPDPDRVRLKLGKMVSVSSQFSGDVVRSRWD